MKVALALIVAAGCSSVDAADLQELKRRGTLRVVVASVPDPAIASPFARLEGGELVGLEGELLAGFARLHGLRTELVTEPTWDKLLPALLEKRGDVVAGGMTDTPARRQLVDFTVETFPTRTVVVTRKPHRVVQTAAQLREERIGVSRGTSYVDTLLAAGVARARIDASFRAPAAGARAALKDGRITAIVEGVEVALVVNAGDPSYQLGMFLGAPESLAFALRKDSPELRAALDEYVSNVRRSPTWSRLVVKYFGDNALEVLRRVRQP
jgi:ABC-type amino acid transport substrate-binding protein